MVSTPCSTFVFIPSTRTPPGNRNRLRNLFWLRSTRCQVAESSISSCPLWPRIWSMFPFSREILTSSFNRPVGHSFQRSMAMCKTNISIEQVVLGSLKSVFQLDHQVNISLYLTEATTLHHSKESTGLTPSWCFPSLIHLLASQTLKSISFHWTRMLLSPLSVERLLHSMKGFDTHL